MMIDPVVGHPTCDLNLQRRIEEARRERVARAFRRRRRWGGVGRRSGEPVPVDQLRDPGEDVWRGFRF
jgi:hypothetical protein